MIIWQHWVLYTLIVSTVLLLFKSTQECQKGNSFGLTKWLTWLGMFVWGDVVILSIFWMIAAIISLLLQDWLLFLLIISVFWLVRSIGETIYWFLQQFAIKKRDKPESLFIYPLVKNEAAWFMYQVIWQCVTVISLISTAYLFFLWLK